MESIFDRATRRSRFVRRGPEPLYRNIAVIHGAGNSVSEASRLAGAVRLEHADLVIGTQPVGRGSQTIPFDETVAWVLKDRYNTSGRMVREQDPCPCSNGRRFGNCHGR